MRIPNIVDYYDLWDGGTQVEAVGYLTNLIGERAAQWIERNADAPLSLSAHFTAPHWPWESENDAAKAEQIKNSFHFDGGSIGVYRSMVESLDKNVGKILHALKRAGIERQTLVVFTSDNGGERFSKTWPFNGMKGELLEGGIRTPLIARWPGVIEKGSVTDGVAISMDWAPTFAEILLGRNSGAFDSDGVSLLPLLAGRGAAGERTLFWRHNAHGQAAARRGRWKMLKIAGEFYLFDIESDPQERANLKDKHPEIFADLVAAYGQFNASMLSYPDNAYSYDNKAFQHLPDRY